LPPTPFSGSREDLVAEVTRLKRERNAVILSHNYQVPEVQDIADYVGDSLGLSQVAARTEADVIVFCGVHFMAETASIISPQKRVLLPDLGAGCSLAQLLTLIGCGPGRKNIQMQSSFRTLTHRQR